MKKEYKLSECCHAYTVISGKADDPHDVCTSCEKPCGVLYAMDNFDEDTWQSQFIMPCRICINRLFDEQKLRPGHPCSDCIQNMCITDNDVLKDIDTRE